MAAYITRSIKHTQQNLAQRLGFTNEIREIHRLTNNPSIVIIVEQSTSESTHVVVMSLPDRNYFYDRHWNAFPESLRDANITIDDDGINQFLVITGPSYGVYYTLSSSKVAA